MKVAGRVVVVTGGAGGIGRALALRFAREGASAVMVGDLDGEAAQAAGEAVVALGVGGLGIACDSGREADIVRLVDQAEERFGPIGLFCSNAGIAEGVDALSENAAGPADAVWNRSWAVNVMSHVWAARALVPRMRARGGGWFLHTASAAGLLSQVGGSVYATTKHAAVGFAENLAISHRAHGIRVALLCPQGVDTAMLRGMPDNPATIDGVLTPDEVAESVIQGLEAETFLILPHPKVRDYMRRKAEDYDRWIGGMAKLQRGMRESAGGGSAG